MSVSYGAAEMFVSKIPGCADSTVGGTCVEEPPSSKGFVVYQDLDECAESFINLPGINLLPTWLLAVMWGLFLLWAFFGVAVVSDAFVEGVESITSEKKIYKRKDASGKEVEREEPVWNWAVANITLLALGTSSPEILLALVETLLTLGKEAGSIGPACIIGSSAYNFFGILAVCTISLPVGVFKKIEHTKVFAWTTGWSIWAHIWMYLVFKVITPDEITAWEAFVTLGHMPAFVYTTWLVDTRGWAWFGANKNAVVPTQTDEEGGELAANKEGAAWPALTHEVQSIERPPEHHSILYYRSLAVQKMAGGGGVSGKHHNVVQSFSGTGVDLDAIDGMDKSVPKVMLKTSEVSVLESVGEVRVQVMRLHGDLNSTLVVQYSCKDDTAVAGLDYEATEGTLTFGWNEEVKEIVVKIVDDDMSEPDVVFHVKIVAASVKGGGDVTVLRNTCAVTIIDDDDGGVGSFELPNWEAGIQDNHAEITVIRRSGADGRVTIDYTTKDGSAVAGKHFSETSGTLVFNAGETRQTIQVPLLPFAADELIKMPAFRLTLRNPTGGLVLGTRNECRVVLVPGSKLANKVKAAGSAEDEEEFELWSAWGQRFKEAILPEYDAEEGSVWVAMLLHYIAFTFKLITACIPPAKWKQGYPTFLVSLAVLGMLMVIVNEVASMFGCAMGLSDLMNGMSIVAMGTSLPDTFASRMAALHDATADAAIGNIMGSNCVNVFLGLGLPWVIAALYYVARGEIFVVKAEALGFAVMIFCILAAFAIALLIVRRRQGGELGGATAQGQWIAFSLFLSLWLIFLMLAGLYDYGHIPDAGF